jgi:hypothetical protein
MHAYAYRHTQTHLAETQCHNQTAARRVIKPAAAAKDQNMAGDASAGGRRQASGLFSAAPSPGGGGAGWSTRGEVLPVSVPAQACWCRGRRAVGAA